MRKAGVILYLALFSCVSQSFAQEEKKSSIGFGIEEGAGYNTMHSTLVGDRDLFWIQPTVRIFYSFKLKDISETTRLKMPVFIGYYTFGGVYNVITLIPEDSLKRENLIFRSMEIGINPCLEIKNFQVGVLFKAQFIFSAIEKLYYEGFRKTMVENDVSKSYKNYSGNGGLKLRYKIKKFSLGTEAWFGLINLYSNTSVGAKLTENNYRLLLGYEF
ncbi:MAG TPA: hypothetical protein VI461_05825 [Chitinophagaceae bacterium]|nr:hypothetical protein [Chitinophagaceae bacterium]